MDRNSQTMDIIVCIHLPCARIIHPIFFLFLAIPSLIPAESRGSRSSSVADYYLCKSNSCPSPTFAKTTARPRSFAPRSSRSNACLATPGPSPPAWGTWSQLIGTRRRLLLHSFPPRTEALLTSSALPSRFLPAQVPPPSSNQLRSELTGRMP